MVEEITLPANANVIGQIALPISNNGPHTRIFFKCREHVQVVRHQDEKGKAPYAPFEIETR